MFFFFFFKQKTAYEMRISDWSSDVCSSDLPLFNAGKGAVFTHDGRNELDASLMDGATRMAGAVAGVHNVKNPILLAREVMQHSPHVMMAGAGAEDRKSVV